MEDTKTVVMALRLIAALAAKTADDVEKGKTWPGDVAKTVEQITKQLRDCRG